MLVKFGNAKLPKTTAVFNMGSAHTCPSKRLGLCQAYRNGRCVCYALRDEVTYPNVRPYRNRQAQYWAHVSAADFVRDLMDRVRRRHTSTKALRLNESGDFRSQRDVHKAELIARMLKHFGISTYCYTARRDLDFSGVRSLIISASGGWESAGVAGKFVMIGKDDPVPAGFGVCPGDCRKCNRCLRGLNTVVREH